MSGPGKDQGLVLLGKEGRTSPPTTCYLSHYLHFWMARIGGNHASETVRDWEYRMGRYKKGIGAVQEDNDTDDDIVPSRYLFRTFQSTPSRHLYPIFFFRKDLQTLRS